MTDPQHSSPVTDTALLALAHRFDGAAACDDQCGETFVKLGFVTSAERDLLCAALRRPAQRRLDRDAVAAVINDRTMIDDFGFVQNSEAVADAILALAPAQCAPLPGLVSTLRSYADDCENEARWAVPELAPLFRRAADVIEAGVSPVPSTDSRDGPI